MKSLLDVSPSLEFWLFSFRCSLTGDAGFYPTTSEAADKMPRSFSTLTDSGTLGEKNRRHFVVSVLCLFLFIFRGVHSLAVAL